MDAVGAGVSGRRAGRRVGLGHLGGHCGACELCRRGDSVHCADQPVLGDSQDRRLRRIRRRAYHRSGRGARGRAGRRTGSADVRGPHGAPRAADVGRGRRRPYVPGYGRAGRAPWAGALGGRPAVRRLAAQRLGPAHRGDRNCRRDRADAPRRRAARQARRAARALRGPSAAPPTGGPRPAGPGRLGRHRADAALPAGRPPAGRRTCGSGRRPSLGVRWLGAEHRSTTLTRRPSSIRRASDSPGRVTSSRSFGHPFRSLAMSIPCEGGTHGRPVPPSSLSAPPGDRAFTGICR
ncbi:hypothetical protein FRZ03_07375 [Streptomyces misionensis]|uniref:Uncharacterized protein n=1 Tax=Streptomyces misionensis TaxID=67331 RepID=A0A5C6K1J8_9ACTN|nr:hypothetical protein FRZ03_07375 [Streptomyces misionensis]